MFVYQGKLKWFCYGQDETFVVVLPNGFARDGDTAYLFSQWTHDVHKRQKYNWFQTLIVSGLTKNSDGDDSFVLKGAYYTWTITTQKIYSKLNITMSNPYNDKNTMAFDRIWQSKGEQDTGNARVWTGKFNWLEFANNEPVIFIVPDGFGDGKPILSLWQWTKDSKGQTKAPSFRDAVQKALSDPSSDQYKFSYTSYYDITCTWDKKTEKLAVHMKEGGNLQQDVANLNLSGKIDRERPGHAHSFSPPEGEPKKTEVAVRLPPAQASLRRLLTPLPFPGNLIDTLEHTYAFLDQAGHYARYAQDRFASLDADYHLQLQLVEALQKEGINLKNQIKTLTDALNVADVKGGELQKQLDDAKAEAKNKEDELKKKIADLQKHDSEDEKEIDGLRKELKAAEAKIDELKTDLIGINVAKRTLEATVDALNLKVDDLESKNEELENTLKALRKLNEELTAKNDKLTEDNGALTATKDELQPKLADAQDALAKALEELKQAQIKLTAAGKLHDHDVRKLLERGEEIERSEKAARKKTHEAEKSEREARKEIRRLKDLLIDNDIEYESNP
ncbi:hypothetical protein NM208_g3476 [Fusarium decemcellulare]|uniref:Uncharacterized protein n=1 Tax=Fusarium decemcellulare TaxID=57161 RepID=A0ACC1SP19_9HYPO|nr:hypothetical protein NM208_g3476 [Fusarium decemcellulare]